jgi:hypothetical protein
MIIPHIPHLVWKPHPLDDTHLMALLGDGERLHIVRSNGKAELWYHDRQGRDLFLNVFPSAGDALDYAQAWVGDEGK